jgi:Tol biopolymer transport system component
VPVRDGRAGTPELLRPDFSGDPLGLTSDGTLYYSVISGGPDIYTASFDQLAGRLSSEPAPLLHPAAVPRQGGDWSPDGRYIAYFSFNGRATESKALWIREAATGQARHVAYALPYVNAWFVKWTPDGKSIVTFGRDAKGRQGLFRIDVQTGETLSLASAESCNSHPPSDLGLTPDGAATFCLNTDRTAILRFDIASKASKELLRGRDLEVFGASPDGRYLAYKEATAAGKTEALKILTLASGDMKEIVRVDLPLQLFRPAFAWTPDSRSVVFKKRGGDTNEMWFAPIDGRPSHRIEMPLAVTAGWHFNPKTNQVTFGVGAGIHFEVWKMENFLPARSDRH